MLPPEVSAWYLPTQSYGKSNEHSGFPGTIMLSAATLMAVVRDIAASLHASGFTRLMFFNTHGGNKALLEMMCRDLRAEFGLLCFLVQGDAGADQLPPLEARFGIHANTVETALMLHLTPELVQTPLPAAHYPAFHSEAFNLTSLPQVGWLTRDWSPEGHFGDPSVASAGDGQQWFDHMARRLAEQIAEASTFTVGTPEAARVEALPSILANVRLWGRGEPVSLHLAGGRFVQITPYQPGHAEEFGGRALLPGLVEPHVHLDKTLSVGQGVENHSSTLAEAIELCNTLSAGRSQADFEARAEAALRLALSRGVTHLRTHINVGSSATRRCWRRWRCANAGAAESTCSSAPWASAAHPRRTRPTVRPWSGARTSSAAAPTTRARPPEERSNRPSTSLRRLGVQSTCTSTSPRIRTTAMWKR